MSVVLLERPSAQVALLRLNRPDVKNALNMEVRRTLAGHFRELGEDRETRCVVLTGGDDAFAAGADLNELAEADAIEMMQRGVHLLWRAITQCPKPLIAAVNGFALGGGCELALHADIIVAGDGAKFGQPEVRVGIMPGAGGTQRLVRAIGKYRAMRLVLTGQMIGAAEALQMGFVSEVVPAAELLPHALKLANQIAALPPLAVQQIKEVVIAGEDASLETALMLERKAFNLLFASRDQKEGMRAFLEKRKPAFEGR